MSVPMYTPPTAPIAAAGIESSLATTTSPDAANERLQTLRAMLDKFKERALSRFEGYIMGMALAPPETEGDRKDKVNVLVLVDDQDSTKMTKDDLHGKLTKALETIATETDPQLAIDVLLITEVWQSCYDGKHDLLQLIAVSAPIYDGGMLGAIKISEIHKSMVVKKFEKYIACYVLAGSIVRGKATPRSDIDTFVVIDDTDVKKMTRVELKDKLRAIINDMAIQAGQMTGIQNKLSIQVYILTDFWDNLKEANPIIFTFLRDGVPFYDRGVFMPWKQLLKMGKIRPSPEAIEIYKSYGDQGLERIRFKLRDIAVEEMWYATITPSQAAIMLAGFPPPAPRETPEVLRELFVKKEKLFDEKHVKFLERVIKTHKDVEYGTKKTITGTEVQEMLEQAEEYLKALGELYQRIEERAERDRVLHTYENVMTIMRDILTLSGAKKVAPDDAIRLFEKEVVHKGHLPERTLRQVRELEKAKREYDAGKLTKAESAAIQRDTGDLLKTLIEHVQRIRGRELERVRVRLQHGEKVGELLILGMQAFLTIDLDSPERDIRTARLTPEGGLADAKDSSLEDLERAIAEAKPAGRVTITDRMLADLREIIGNDVRVLL